MIFARVAATNNSMFVAHNARFFAKKTKKGKASDSEAATATEDEAEAVAEPVVEAVAEPVAEPVKAAPAKANAKPIKMDKALFNNWSVGDIKQQTSAPDHKAPAQEGTIEGRYA